jgi:hypothetical protein
MKSVTFIHNEAGEAEYAVMPISMYRELMPHERSASKASTHPLLSKDKTMVQLPYGGPNTFLSIDDLVAYLKNNDITHLAINQRAQTLDSFPLEQAMTLDPIIRREFLVDSSPYRNTMQATTEVIDALVVSGRFRRVKQRYDFFSRAVNSIELVD